MPTDTERIDHLDLVFHLASKYGRGAKNLWPDFSLENVSARTSIDRAIEIFESDPDLLCWRWQVEYRP